ncbi:MAG: hypothetical protein ACP5OG_03090 [Candidatus Nanoarchaeia archaeon]
MENKLSNKYKKKIVQNWIFNHGAAEFDLKKRDIILHDGGLFSIEKEVKIKPKTRVLWGELKDNGLNSKYSKFREIKFIPIKRKGKVLKEKVEEYKAYLWFEELDNMIGYFKSMKRMLNKIGYKTKRDFE